MQCRKDEEVLDAHPSRFPSDTLRSTLHQSLQYSPRPTKLKLHPNFPIAHSQFHLKTGNNLQLPEPKALVSIYYHPRCMVSPASILYSALGSSQAAATTGDWELHDACAWSILRYDDALSESQ